MTVTGTFVFQPYFGAIASSGGAQFRVWAPSARRVGLLVSTAGVDASHAMTPSTAGVFGVWVPDIAAGALYRYRLDDGAALPDPASRFQPDGVHGPSMVIDPSAFAWTDAAWTGPRERGVVLYELHVGTFTPEGTFAGVESRLDALADLGVTAIELMPLAEFAGRWNWGYDGVDLFAPSHNYGTPDDLRRLVDAAHARGLAVIVDVVYNHFGPDGAYVHSFSPHFQTGGYETPWGGGVNLDGAHGDVVRRFVVDNALHWIHEYHMDGLRMDATHTLRDESDRHFLAELADAVHGSVTGRRVLVYAEDERNEATLVRSGDRGGYGLDGVWADDFHHHVRRAVAGDSEGYYQSYSGATSDIAETIRSGWFFKGQHCRHMDAPRGTDPAGVPLHRFITCLQNHDQIGNRPFGDRLHHAIAPEVFRAVSALLLLAPETPLLFMGQEWAASSPFLFFTDHNPELGRAITEGRRTEFGAFSAFADPSSRNRIPDPQDPQTFRASRLQWDERHARHHAQVLALYRALLHLRHSLTGDLDAAPVDARALDDDTVGIEWASEAARSKILVVVRLRGGEATVDLSDRVGGGECRVLLTTDDPDFVDGGRPPGLAAASAHLQFHGAAAIVVACAA